MEEVTLLESDRLKLPDRDEEKVVFPVLVVGNQAKVRSSTSASTVSTSTSTSTSTVSTSSTMNHES